MYGNKDDDGKIMNIVTDNTKLNSRSDVIVVLFDALRWKHLILLLSDHKRLNIFNLINISLTDFVFSRVIPLIVERSRIVSIVLRHR